MKVWRSGTSECSFASSRTSSSDGVSSRSTATAIQHLVRVAQLHAPLGQEHRQVVEDVRGLLGNALVGLVARGARDLLGLLLDLAAHELAVRQEAARVGVGAAPLPDRSLQDGERLAGDRVELTVVEAGAL